MKKIDKEEMVILIQIKGPFNKKKVKLLGSDFTEVLDPGKNGEKLMFVTKKVAQQCLYVFKNKYRLLDMEVAKNFLSLPEPDAIATPELLEELVGRYAEKGTFVTELYPLILDERGDAFALSHVMSDVDLSKECCLRGHRMIGLKAYEQLKDKAENGELKARLIALEKNQKIMSVDEIAETEVNREIPEEVLAEAKVVHDANKKEAVEAKQERDSLKDLEPAPYTNFGKMKYDDMRPYATANGVNYNAKKGVMMEALIKIQSKGNLKLPAKRD